MENRCLVRRSKVLKSTSFATKESAFMVLNYSQFNNNLVAAFTTNGAEQLVLPQFSLVLRMLKNTFTIFPVSSQGFRCLDHTDIFFFFLPFQGQNDRNNIKLTCTRGFRWIAGSTSNDSIRRPGRNQG